MASGSAWPGCGSARRTAARATGRGRAHHLPVLRYEEISLGRAPLDGLSRLAQALTLAVPGGGTLRIVNALTHRMTSPGQLIPAARLSGSTGPTLIMRDLNMPGPATWTARHIPPGGPRPGLPRTGRWSRSTCWPGRHQGRAAEVLPPVGSDHLPVRAQLLIG
jgi:endonuclease/exonuclease/phosphatase family metal-dependent hydrolase